MNDTVTSPPNPSLTALRGAVGGFVGSADDGGCWKRVVSIWRIFLALDRLIAVLWAIVERLRAGDGLVDGVRPAKVAPSEAPRVGELRPIRARAVTVRCVPTAMVVSVGRVLPDHRPPVAWVWPGSDRVGILPVLSVRSRLILELWWAAAHKCV